MSTPKAAHPWSMCRTRSRPSARQRAEAIISLSAEAYRLVVSGTAKKGDVLATARIAGIMAAKKTSELIPLCHPLALSHVGVDFEPLAERNAFRIIASAKTTGPTGVEMEALDRGLGRRADRLRHGEGRRQGRCRRIHPSADEVRRQERELRCGARACNRTPSGAGAAQGLVPEVRAASADPRSRRAQTRQPVIGPRRAQEIHDDEPPAAAGMGEIGLCAGE